MADAANIFKEFLVKIGFDVSESQHQHFTDAIASATLKVVGLGAAIEATAVAMVAGVGQMAASLDSLYFVAKRVGDTVQHVKMLAFSGEQVGISADHMRSSLEGVANFLRSNPAAGGFLYSIGVQTIDPQTGLPRSTSDIIDDVGRALRRMPQWRAQQFGAQIGLDTNTTFALRNYGQQMDQWQKLYNSIGAAMGVDFAGASVAAKDFTQQANVLGVVFDNLQTKIVAALGEPLAAQMQRFGQMIVSHAAQITRAITTVANGIVWAGQQVLQISIAIGEVIGSVSDWFNSLSVGARTLTELIAGIGIAFVALRGGMVATMVAFMASPLGLFITSIGALLALVDDYMAFEQHRPSHFDWSGMDKFLKDHKAIFDQFAKAFDFVGGWQTALKVFAAWMAASWLTGILKTLGLVKAAATATFAAEGAGAAGGAGAALGTAAAMTGFIGAIILITPVMTRLSVALDRWLEGYLNDPTSEKTRRLIEQGKVQPPNFHIPETYRAVKDVLTGAWGDALKYFGIGGDTTAPLASAHAALTHAIQSAKKPVDDLAECMTKLVYQFIAAYAAFAGLETPQMPGDPRELMAGAYAATTVLPDTTSPEFQQEYGLAPGTSPLAPTGIIGRAKEFATVAWGSMSKKGKLALKYFTSQGYSLAQAAGIVSNLEAESGMNPNAVGDNGLARGLAQWHPDRWSLLTQMFGPHPSFEQQLAFVAWELKNTEAAAGRALKAATTPAQAGAAVSMDYERPADTMGQANLRAAGAEDIASANADVAAPVAPVSTAATPPAPALSFPPIVVAAHAAAPLVNVHVPAMVAPLGAPHSTVIHHHGATTTQHITQHNRPSIVVHANGDGKSIAKGVAAAYDAGNAKLIRNFYPSLR